MGAEITVNTAGLLKSLNLAADTIKDWTEPLTAWGSYFARATADEWAEHLYRSDYRHPTSFRGAAVWPGVPPQYTRKTDGVSVPPWGGVRRIKQGYKRIGSNFVRATPTGPVIPTTKLVVRHEKVFGLVQGRLQPSGYGALGSDANRVTPGTVIGFDTGRMINEFTAFRNGYRAGVIGADKRSITLSTMVKYAAQFNRRRHIDRVIPADVKKAQEFASAHIVRKLKAARIGSGATRTA
jgi:hypothetical protein